MSMVYQAIFQHEEEGGYSVSFPALEGCYSQGDDDIEALAMGQEAMSLWLNMLREEGKPIPPSDADRHYELGSNETVLLVSELTPEQLDYRIRQAERKVNTNGQMD